MSDNIDKLLEQLRDVSPPCDLQGRVLSSIRRETRIKKAKNGSLSISLMFTIPLTFLSLKLLAADMAMSPLGQLLSLGVTDWRQIGGVSNAWLMALLESIPGISLALTLSMLFVMTFLTARVIKLLLDQTKRKHGTI